MTREERFKMDMINEFKQMCEIVEKDGLIISNKQRMLKALAQEPCEDAISRKEVLDLCDSKDPDYKVIHFKEDVECLPSVRPQEQTGHWIKKDGYSDCSECGSHIVTEWDYCPNCGCAMKGEL